ncbi:MAG: MerR family DNA-binding transcriptional regulator [Thermoguttaceae bacterium]|nr:MerR family DNA-binding transcriptional regulator [Thermoguttaceae bacterium]MDW8080064.1 MerR family DNA-binding transcriptional regulator [Thermoguttaceae bacterium]
MFVTPRQLAQATGLSESTIKRWCDRGLLPSQRTPGGHRRLKLAEVVAILRSRSVPVVDALALGLPPFEELARDGLAGARQALLDALIHADRHRVNAILHALVLGGISIATIGDAVISPVFAQIGEWWACREIEVFQEREACLIAEEALRELKHFFPPPALGAPLGIGGTLTGDWYILPGLLVELVLMAHRWEARFLGTNLPAHTCAEAIRRIRPELFWLSLSHVASAEEVVEATKQLAEVAQDVHTLVVVGGRELAGELESRIFASACCRNLAQLELLLRTLPITGRRSAEPPNIKPPT